MQYDGCFVNPLRIRKENLTLERIGGRGRSCLVPKGFNSATNEHAREAIFLLPVIVMNKIVEPIISTLMARENGELKERTDTRKGIIAGTAGNTCDVLASIMCTYGQIISPIMGNLKTPFCAFVSRSKEFDNNSNNLPRSPTKTIDPLGSGLFRRKAASKASGFKGEKWGDARPFSEPGMSSNPSISLLSCQVSMRFRW